MVWELLHCHVVILCFISAVWGGGWGPADGGEGGPVLGGFSPGDLLEWGHLITQVWSCLALLFGCTWVLEAVL